MGTKESILESKVMLLVYLESLGAAELRVLWLQRSPCVRSWVVFLSTHYFLIKRILLPMLYCAYHMYIGLMNMFNDVINMLFI